MTIGYIPLQSIFFVNLVAGLCKYQEKSHIMHVKRAKNRPKKSRWAFFNVRIVEKWFKSF